MLASITKSNNLAFETNSLFVTLVNGPAADGGLVYPELNFALGSVWSCVQKRLGKAFFLA